MSRHEDTVSLRQMLDHIEEAVALARGRTRDDLESDRVFFLALLKLVEIVGEAATRVSRCGPRVPHGKCLAVKTIRSQSSPRRTLQRACGAQTAA